MTRFIVGIAVVVALVVGSPRRAHACGAAFKLDGGEVAALLAIGGVYVGTTIGMGIKDVHPGDDSRAYGVVEAAFNAPFAAFWGMAVVSELRHHETPSGVFLVMAGVHTGLAIHGIYTAARSRDTDMLAIPHVREDAAMFQLGRVRGAIVPASLAGGGGLGLTGAF